MIGTRYETYTGMTGTLPFLLNTTIQRTAQTLSAEQNWHDNLELQLCTGGQGTVRLNGRRYDFLTDDVIVVDSNTIHYTETSAQLTYACLIVSTAFCRQMGIAYDQLSFSPRIQDPQITELFRELIRIYEEADTPLRIARLNRTLLNLLIALETNHVIQNSPIPTGKSFHAVKQTITYLRQHYPEKVTLDAISQEVMLDKYALCRVFRAFTGQTIFESLNLYRCQMAAEWIRSGSSVSEAAASCGFENLSYFSRTFLKNMGYLPSQCRKLP